MGFCVTILATTNPGYTDSLFKVMCSMKNCLLYFWLLFLVACQNSGDGRESPTDKQEWSILQGLEYSSRNDKNIKFEIIEKSGYSIAVVPNETGIGAIFIMLNPKSAPFYKQMPNKLFVLTEGQFNMILKNDKLISTVEEALRSHLKNENT